MPGMATCNGPGPSSLKRWREKRKLTKARLGMALGLADGSMIKDYEKRRRELPLRHKIALADFAGDLPLSKLLNAQELAMLSKACRLLRQERAA